MDAWIDAHEKRIIAILKYLPGKLHGKTTWYVRDKTDEACKLAIIIRDGGRCITCDRDSDSAVVGWGHLLTAAALSTRYFEQNIYCQCNPCNQLHEHRWDIYMGKWIELNGAEAYERLREKHWKSSKPVMQDRINWFVYWQSRLREEIIKSEYAGQFREYLKSA
jgi:hypothetical protein